MCGITGKISFAGFEIESSHLKAMNSAIVHRGPNDTGVYISPDQTVGLGHQRLSIIDLSPAGHQPMRYMDRYEIVFNGEIYNWQEERRQLETLGYRFTSNSDTEIIMALYDRYQENCVLHLRGMFAFAIYDERERILFCARDRVGKKPFKYYFDNNVFIFASELKAILTQSEYVRSVDYTAIHHYLTLQYVPAPLTGFTGIKKLLPAHYIKINIKDKIVKIQKYWHLDYSHKLELSEREWARKITSTLEEATRMRMMADVPLGAFLSGGIDSSAVVALMAKHSSTPIKTFSIGFEEEKYNELPFAKRIAKLYQTDHTEFIVNPEAIEILPYLVKQYEEPYADSSALPTYYLSKLTREHVTVALNGDGGDENFAGYGRYSVQKFSLWYDRVRWLHHTLAIPTTRHLARYIQNTLLERADRFASTMSEPYPHRYVNYICYFSNAAKKHLYTKSFFDKVGLQDSYDIIARQFAIAHTSHPLDQTLYADIATYLPDDLLVKVDIATMAVGLEGRSPFLDHKFMELTAQIPFHLKLKGLNTKKYILKKALEGILPDPILYRPKMGFGVPIERWFRGDLQKFTANILLSDRASARGLFRPEAVQKLLKIHTNSNINYANHIWALLTLELWLREYFD